MTVRAAEIPCSGDNGGPFEHGPPTWDDAAVGEWLHEELIACFGVEEDPWALGLVATIAGRLNAVRAPAPPLEPVILWSAHINAFIGPGRYLYLMRGLLHRAWWEDAIALTMAHEMAHHDLGHTQILSARFGWARRLRGVAGAALFLTLTERWLNGPEHEACADAFGLDLCLKAGYNKARCLELFDVFEAVALDHGDIDGVFGPEHVSDEDAHGIARWMAELHSWSWRRVRGYPCLRDRKGALLTRLNEHTAAPLPIPGTPSRRR
jgi:hypothetical protein